MPIFKIVSTIKTYKRLNTFKLKYTLQNFKYNSKVKHINSMCCYLCDSQSLIRSLNQKAINFAGQIYAFFRCKKCGSYSLFPKLDQDITLNCILANTQTSLVTYMRKMALITYRNSQNLGSSC